MSNESIRVIDTLFTDIKLSDREINEIVEKVEEKYQDNDLCLERNLIKLRIANIRPKTKHIEEAYKTGCGSTEYSMNTIRNIHENEENRIILFM